MGLPGISSLKAIGRRKSAGNSLDAGVFPTEGASSFKVLPRKDLAKNQSESALDTHGHAAYLPARQSSYEDDFKAAPNRYVPHLQLNV
jgi:hypothetical protein